LKDVAVLMLMILMTMAIMVTVKLTANIVAAASQ